MSKSHRSLCVHSPCRRVTASLPKSPRFFLVFWPIFVIWMVITCPLISNSSSSFTNSLWIVPSTLTTTDIIITITFEGVFSSLGGSIYLFLFSCSFNSILWFAGTAKYPIRYVVFFFFFLLSQGLVVWPRLSDAFLFQHLGEVCVSNLFG